MVYLTSQQIPIQQWPVQYVPRQFMCNSNRSNIIPNRATDRNSTQKAGTNNFCFPTAFQTSPKRFSGNNISTSLTCSGNSNKPIESVMQLNTANIPDYEGCSYVKKEPMFREPTKQCHIRWQRQSHTNSKVNFSEPSAFTRFTIQELIQQGSLITSNHYPIDQPSSLVQIECRKPGCRCVLKNEMALALKIVSNVSLLKAYWLSPETHMHLDHKTNFVQHASKTVSAYNLENNSNLTTPVSSAQRCTSGPVALTSCCPSWFEVVRKCSDGPTDFTPHICPDVPIWTSAKTVWRVRPRFLLLRKSIQCFIALTSQPIIMSSTDMSKTGQQNLSLDGSNLITLGSGTVLHPIDCRACQLVRSDVNSTSSRNPMNLLSARHSTKLTSMIQCLVVGSKALASIANRTINLAENELLYCFKKGPRLIYVPLDSKTFICSPISVSSDMLPYAATPKWSTLSHPGVHSLISLLRQYRLPVIVRPVLSLHPNQTASISRADDHDAERLNSKTFLDIYTRVSQPLLQLESCFHGKLIFIEPLFDYNDGNLNENKYAHGKLGKEGLTNNSRFFVVTADMLANHNFILAEESSNLQYAEQLEAHAHRVAQFLTTCHPIHGITYLIRNLEDATHTSNTGPSHIALTRTLGPVGVRERDMRGCMMVNSVAAFAAIATEDDDDLFTDPMYVQELGEDLLENKKSENNRMSTTFKNQSVSFLANSRTITHSSISSTLLAGETDQMNALCDEIEDIYFYVRNGRFPNQSRSMTSLAHDILPAIDHYDNPLRNSAPISPEPYGRSTGRISERLRSNKRVEQQAHLGTKKESETNVCNYHEQIRQNPAKFNSLDSHLNRGPVLLFYRRESDGLHRLDENQSQQFQQRIQTNNSRANVNKHSPHQKFINHPAESQPKVAPRVVHDISTFMSKSSVKRQSSQTNIPDVQKKVSPKTYTNTRVLSMAIPKSNELAASVTHASGMGSSTHLVGSLQTASMASAYDHPTDFALSAAISSYGKPSNSAEPTFHPSKKDAHSTNFQVMSKSLNYTSELDLFNPQFSSYYTRTGNNEHVSEVLQNGVKLTVNLRPSTGFHVNSSSLITSTNKSLTQLDELTKQIPNNICNIGEVPIVDKRLSNQQSTWIRSDFNRSPTRKEFLVLPVGSVSIPNHQSTLCSCSNNVPSSKPTSSKQCSVVFTPTISSLHLPEKRSQSKLQQSIGRGNSLMTTTTAFNYSSPRHGHGTNNSSPDTGLGGDSGIDVALHVHPNLLAQNQWASATKTEAATLLSKTAFSPMTKNDVFTGISRHHRYHQLNHF